MPVRALQQRATTARLLARHSCVHLAADNAALRMLCLCRLGYGSSDSGCNPTPRLVESLKGRRLVKVAAAKHHTGAEGVGFAAAAGLLHMIVGATSACMAPCLCLGNMDTFPASTPGSCACACACYAAACARTCCGLDSQHANCCVLPTAACL
jgi:hypothetical protein